jgi:hypothetical protein
MRWTESSDAQNADLRGTLYEMYARGRKSDFEQEVIVRGKTRKISVRVEYGAGCDLDLGMRGKFKTRFRLGRDQHSICPNAHSTAAHFWRETPGFSNELIESSLDRL